MAASAPTGGTITTSGEYTIHTFTSSGTFTVPYVRAGKTLRVLIVAGGGAGGGSWYWAGHDGPGAGGGGGGEVKDLPSVPMSAGSFPIVVGQGGAAISGNGGDGGNSSAFGNTSTGGKGGYHNRDDVTAYYGYGGNSGNGYTGASRNGNCSGGGAGAGGNGSVGNTSTRGGGAGGIGVYSDITGSTVGYGGGGGAGGPRQYMSYWRGGYGATAYGGGNGHGYNGSSNDPGGPNDGYANRGGGGGGQRAYEEGGVSTGSPGGSGIVIIKFLTLDIVQPIYGGML